MVSLPTTKAAQEGVVVTGRRESQRARLQLAATITTTTRDFQVVIRNLSCTGAMVEGPELPLSGRTVTFTRGTIDVLAEVVWVRGERCGLHFDEPLEYDEVVAHAKAPPETVGAAPKPAYAATPVRSDRLSAEEWKRAKDILARDRR